MLLSVRLQPSPADAPPQGINTYARPSRRTMPMHYHALGKTGIKVSEICLGTMHFGWKTDEATSCAILDAFRDVGGNFIQAASSTRCSGVPDLLATALSEEHVGRWLRSADVARDDVVLATRLVLRDRGPAGVSLPDFIRKHCEAALRRFGTDHLDLLLIEWSAAMAPIDGILEALTPLVWNGLVRSIGASGFPAWRLMEARARASARSLPAFSTAQHDFSMVRRTLFEPEIGEFCRETGTAFLARSPLAGGFLVGTSPGRRTWVSPSRAALLRDHYHDCSSLNVRDALQSLADRRGLSVAQAALAWVLAQPGVTAAVIGVTSPTQLRGLLPATEAQAPDDMHGDPVTLHPMPPGAPGVPAAPFVALRPGMPGNRL